MTRRTTATAYARAGLLGNPSDQYGGKALACSIFDFEARVELAAADRFAVISNPEERLDGAHFKEVAARLRERGCYEADRLVRAAIVRFAEGADGLGAIPDDDPSLKFHLRYETGIPRQAGLAGSSALVIATLRALAHWFDRPLGRVELAERALAAEVEDLGIAAGPMDRVIQSYEGLMHMDFAEPRTPASYRRLDPGLLPPLFLGWDPRIGRASGAIHRNVRLRWLAGDPEVRGAMEVFPALVDEGVACLERGDVAGFKKCVDRNFDTRASIFDLGERDVRMVEIGRARGAAVKLCGSGGAVVGVMDDPDQFSEIEGGFRQAGFRAIRPRLAADAP